VIELVVGGGGGVVALAADAARCGQLAVVSLMD